MANAVPPERLKAALGRACRTAKHAGGVGAPSVRGGRGWLQGLGGPGQCTAGPSPQAAWNGSTGAPRFGLQLAVKKAIGRQKCSQRANGHFGNFGDLPRGKWGASGREEHMVMIAVYFLADSHGSRLCDEETNTHGTLAGIHPTHDG